GGEHDCAAGGRAKREGLARKGSEASGALEEDSVGSIAAIPARSRAGAGRSGKTREYICFLQGWFARDAFRASNRFAAANGFEGSASDKGNHGDRSGRGLDRSGIRGGSKLWFSGNFAGPIDSAHGDRCHCRTGVAKLRARRRIIDRAPVPRTSRPFDKYPASASNHWRRLGESH